jgi:hypothetical protein
MDVNFTNMASLSETAGLSPLKGWGMMAGERRGYDPLLDRGRAMFFSQSLLDTV